MTFGSNNCYQEYFIKPNPFDSTAAHPAPETDSAPAIIFNPSRAIPQSAGKYAGDRAITATSGAQAGSLSS